ncbi:hypothetical protein Adt_14413 [Abeliophyllum distichum]|uniref:Uncharacterized protein n=1 Tax=Abeliophyllum distichum TaxID=126358 RepID=A0ABD1TZL6_9LAMI
MNNGDFFWKMKLILQEDINVDLQEVEKRWTLAWGKTKAAQERKNKQVTSSGTSVDERAIAREVLTERQGHVRGVGRDPKGKSPSLDSIGASNALQGAIQFSDSAHYEDPWFAMHEA